jgi:aspartate/methionine/tyrosine aminotransferase
VPGSAFGAEGTIRIAYAKSIDILSAGLDALDSALRALV